MRLYTVRTDGPGGRPRQFRRGAVAVEAAVVYPVMFVLLFAIIVGGMGVFRYQMTAYLARTAARHAAVRGSDWAREGRPPPPTQAEIAAAVVGPSVVAMDPAAVTVRVEWVNGVTGAATDWDVSRKTPVTLNAAGDAVANRVRVTVTYRWRPEVYLGGPIDLRSFSEVPMAF